MEFLDESKQCNEFFENPSFVLSGWEELSICRDNVSDEAWNIWKTYTTPNILVSSLETELKYFYVKQRYRKLTQFLSNPWPALLVVLAEAHFWLSDLSGSLELLKRVKEIIHYDERLEHILSMISQIILLENSRDDLYHLQTDREPFQQLHEFQSPMDCPVVEVNSTKLSSVLKLWEDVQSAESKALEQFIRHSCIATNELEDVFKFDGHSWPRLVRSGFFTNSIEGISLTSKLKKKDTIIRILKNTAESLNHISTCLDDPNTFTTEFILNIHRVMLQGDNIDSEDCGDGTKIYRLLSAGEFRKVACITYHNENKDITQYCHHTEILSQMNNFCNSARILMQEESIDPFMKSAWLQWAFLRIHPFEDGNGRVSRMISSLPLYKLHLPPVVVTSTDKFKYFDALHIADRSSNLAPLSRFLRSSLKDGMKAIFDLAKTKEGPQGPAPNNGKTQRLSLRRGLSMGSSSSESPPQSPSN